MSKNIELPITVVVPVRNDANRIVRCLKSLIEQRVDGRSAPIVVVDNWSSDSTIEVVSSLEGNINVVSERKVGSYAARNKGLSMVRTPLIAFTDSDCIAQDGWLQNMVYMFTEPNIGAVGGRILSLRDESPVARYSSLYLLNQEKATMGTPESKPYAITANAVFRTNALRSIGGFDSNMISGGDVDAGWRICHEGYKVLYCPDACVVHEHRSTFTGFIKQHLRYGFGHYFLFKKNGKHQSPFPLPWPVEIRRLRNNIHQYLLLWKDSRTEWDRQIAFFNLVRDFMLMGGRMLGGIKSLF
jgi:cellulose synthase/poly-beta-1,6-N-acetylglucosamine synthase-like glycosyltransferase